MKILLADDEPGIAETYAGILEVNGHIVKTTYNGKECLEAYQDAVSKLPKRTESYLANHPPFDVVLLDYKMPEMNGLECAKAILGINKQQRVIFASAYGLSILQESIRNLHRVIELIEKPIELDDLAELVRDRQVYEDLQLINSRIKAEFEPTHEQLTDILRILKFRVRNQGEMSGPSSSTSKNRKTVGSSVF